MLPVKILAALFSILFLVSCGSDGQDAEPVSDDSSGGPIDNSVADLVAIYVVDSSDLTPIYEISDDFNLDLSLLPSSYNFVVESSDTSKTGSVEMVVAGCAVTNRSENTEPYTVAPSSVGFSELELGTCSITATPYQFSDMGGVEGSPLTVTFEVIDSSPDPDPDPDLYTIDLAWLSPSERQDGSAILTGELSGYRILYSSDISNGSTTIEISDPLSLSTSISGLAPGMYEFRIAAIDTSNNSSGYSEPLVVEVGI